MAQQQSSYSGIDPASVPDFDNLPPVEGQPKGCAWGIFDKDGKKDVYGTLNFLTPEVVKAAVSEAKDGVSISLNWPLNGIKFPLPGRAPTAHTAFSLWIPDASLPDPSINPHAAVTRVHGFDDTLSFNTQISSQWDSFCHVHLPSGETYNGFTPTVQTLTSPLVTAHNPLPTIDHWHARGGVVGRGVLVDYKSYIEDTKGETYHTLDGHPITVAEMEEIAAHQGVEFKQGDILLVRTGYTNMLASPTPEDFGKMANMTQSGVEGSEETARWVWNRRFAAVAGDAHAFEAIPSFLTKEDGTKEVLPLSELVLHRYFLNMFGLPIGELWDLEALSAHCKRTGRYSFLLTSAPLNHPGLVASPPNALAIF